MLLHTCFGGSLGTCQPHSRRNPLTLEQGSLASGCTLPKAPGQVSEHCQPSLWAADLGTGDQKPRGPPACPSWSQWGENAGAGGEIPTEGLGCKVGQQGGCLLWDTRPLAAPSASTGVNWAAPLPWGTQYCSLGPQNVALQSCCCCWVAGRGQDAGPCSCCHEETWDLHPIPPQQGWAPPGSPSLAGIAPGGHSTVQPPRLAEPSGTSQQLRQRNGCYCQHQSEELQHVELSPGGAWEQAGLTLQEPCWPWPLPQLSIREGTLPSVPFPCLDTLCPRGLGEPGTTGTRT